MANIDTTLSLIIRESANWSNLPTLAAGTEGVAWSYDFTDLLNGTGLTITLGATAPSWVSLSGNVLSGTPPDEDSNQIYEIPVTISNTVAGVTYSDTAVFMLSVPNEIDAPVWSSSSLATRKRWWDVNGSVNVNLNNVVTGDNVTISLVSGTLPSGINLVDGVIMGTAPGIASEGTLTFRATNSGGTDDLTFDYEVEELSAPVFTQTPADHTVDFSVYDVHDLAAGVTITLGSWRVSSNPIANSSGNATFSGTLPPDTGNSIGFHSSDRVSIHTLTTTYMLNSLNIENLVNGIYPITITVTTSQGSASDTVVVTFIGLDR